MPKEINLQFSKHIFVSKQRSAVIVLAHVVMARWSEHISPELYVYFTNSPHIALGVAEANQFLEALMTYYRGTQGRWPEIGR
jgi:hypothetical protein